MVVEPGLLVVEPAEDVVDGYDPGLGLLAGRERHHRMDVPAVGGGPDVVGVKVRDDHSSDFFGRDSSCGELLLD